ncbi:MAG: ComF family protein [Gammaproteobacteria bacterium]
MSSFKSIRQVYKQSLLHFKNSHLSVSRVYCVLCGERCNKTDTFKSTFLCSACKKDLPIINNPCQVCGMPLSLKSSTKICGSCLNNAPFYQQSLIPLQYNFPVTSLVKQLKFNNKFIYSEILSQILLEKIQQGSSSFPEYIIPVPLHFYRLIKRGFNQSELIAKSLSCQLEIPVDLKCCKRIRNTPHQTGFTINERNKNIRNAFSVNGTFSAKHIAIVDDVVTTGSTVNELARMFQKSGVEKIEIWAAARTILD